MNHAGRFVTDTAVSAVASGRWSGTIDRGWWIQRGPNGGYLAAIVVRALQAEVGDRSRTPRSVTIHYLRPPVEGPVEIHTVVERAGRSLTTVSARMFQRGEVIAVAIAAFAAVRDDSVDFDDTIAPAVAAPDDCPPLDRPPFPLPMRDRYECRLAVGGELFSEGPTALTGGWIRLADGEPADLVVVAALTDAWPPAAFTRVASPIVVPTIDLSIHFRRSAVPDPAGWFLVVFRTTLSTDGYLEEDGEVWSEGGVLLAQSRQLAVSVAVLP